MRALELFRRSTPLLVVHLIVHPVTEEIHFLRGQFHEGVLVPHTYSSQKADGCRARGNDNAKPNPAAWSSMARRLRPVLPPARRGHSGRPANQAEAGGAA